MVRNFMTGFLVLALCTSTLVGCGARAGVAKDKILAKIDSVLGELDVKRKKIELKQKELRDQLQSLRYNAARAEAKLELMNEKKKESEAKLESLKDKLKQVQELVEEAKTSEDGTIKRNEKTYTVADFNEKAKDVIAQYKREQTRLQGMEQGATALSNSVDFLKAQEKTARDLLEKLETKIEAIDAKKYAVDAVKQATSISGESTSINDDLAALEKEIEDLSVDVDATLKVEQAKLDDLNNSSSKVDELLKESPNLDAISNEIDEILNSGK